MNFASRRLVLAAISLLALSAAAVVTVQVARIALADPLTHRAVLPLLAMDGSGPAQATATPTPPAGGGLKCGEERWPVKTLSDPAAESVNFTPQATTVDALRALPAPRVEPETPRMAPYEFQTYTISASLVRMKLEDDRDIHLVVADTQSGDTMIVEFPDVACEGALNSARAAEMASARSAFVAACGPPSTTRFENLRGMLTLTGVLFFDVIHGQSGVAPNGVELHPVLAVSAITCSKD